MVRVNKAELTRKSKASLAAGLGPPRGWGAIFGRTWLFVATASVSWQQSISWYMGASLLVSRAGSHRGAGKSRDTHEPGCLSVCPSPAPANSGLQSVMAAVSPPPPTCNFPFGQLLTEKGVLGNITPEPSNAALGKTRAHSAHQYTEPHIFEVSKSVW